MFESGAMNEAFSDIFGETIDILNHDTADPDHLRTEWPTTCHKTLNSAYGVPPGNDQGTRWSMGENVTTKYPNGDGSIRDMYKPECFFHPSTTDADYYSCTTYADAGGVHKNSGVLNRLYAVITDGGEYQNPADPTGPLLTINPLGFVKSSNLFWRTHQALIETSQYADLADTLNEVCTDNIGLVLYFPNLFNMTLITSDEVLTIDDCANVANAVIGSGMDSTADFCPNVACDAVNIYDCEWVNCTESTTELSYEVL
jgi:bacillolysin